MAKFLRRFVKRRDAASTAGQPEQPRLEAGDDEPRTETSAGEREVESQEKQFSMQELSPRMAAGAGEGEMESEEKHLSMQELSSRTEPKARLTARYSYSADHPDDLSFEEG